MLVVIVVVVVVVVVAVVFLLNIHDKTTAQGTVSHVAAPQAFVRGEGSSHAEPSENLGLQNGRR